MKTLKTITKTQNEKLEAMFAKYDMLVNETLYLDHNEKKGKKSACTRLYNQMTKYIETITDENPANVIYRMMNR